MVAPGLCKAFRAVAVVAVFLVVTWYAYSALGENWSFIDTMYFASGTVTTVGFGDLVPTSDGARVFTIFFMIIGVGFVAISLFTIVRWFNSKKDAWLRVMLLVNRDGQLGAATKGRVNSGCGAGMAILMLQVVFVLCVGFVFMAWEDFTALESLYVTTTIVTGVGYGDIAPKTQSGRLFAALFMPLGLTVVMNSFAEMVVLWEMQSLCSHNRLSSILKLLTDESTAKGKLGGNHGEVTLAEFQLYMVRRMGKLDPALLDEIQAYFEAIDVDGDGVLTHKDLLQEQQGQVRTRSNSGGTPIIV